MSDDLEHQLRADRATRDAARALWSADIANLRANWSGKSLSDRIVSRIGDGANDVLEEAIEVADNHKGVIATLVAAIILWFARDPILDAVGLGSDEDPAEH